MTAPAAITPRGTALSLPSCGWVSTRSQGDLLDHLGWWHYVSPVAMNDKRARDQDRERAIDVVEAAWAEGQIVEADRDKRVESLLQAQTMAEVQMITHDLQLPRTPPPPAAYGEAHVEAVDTPVPVPEAKGSNKGLLFLLLLIPIGLIAGVVGIVVAIAAAVSTAPDGDVPIAPGVAPDPDEVNVLSVEGYADLVAAIEQQTGSTTVFEAVLYPTYAVVDVPVDSTTDREHSYYWDGDLEETGSKGTTDYTRFDLADIDADVVVSIVKKARAKIEAPQTWYSIVRAPSATDDGTWIYGYATNEYGESGYLGGDKAGTLTWDPDDS